MDAPRIDSGLYDPRYPIHHSLEERYLMTRRIIRYLRARAYLYEDWSAVVNLKGALQRLRGRWLKLTPQDSQAIFGHNPQGDEFRELKPRVHWYMIQLSVLMADERRRVNPLP